ncbi:PAS domain S-box protein [Sphingomonas sp. HITSZ_GF]|uniref:PAS domain-containing sensor histidine kinase n=1 Tax=Sphingomonas sp. HITSZ_GF TaxID=3037247 RepID=UPI00240E5F0D|nr:PAS domain S-box protein [Sphingomonas sp. HITSZ_GF]MDG2533983.1 PAS domain S-box protein [Sphingomonas sp. HITSZ_GF]
MAIDPAKPSTVAAPVNRRVAVALAAFGLACGIAAFLGWLLDLPALRGFGLTEYPIWPWTCVGFIGLSIGFLASFAGRRQLTIGALAVPFTIAAISLFERWSGSDLGVDTLLFPGELNDYAFATLGRTGVNPAAAFLVLGLAALGQSLHDLLAKEIRSLAATLALGLAAAAAIVILFSRPGNSVGVPLLATSLPGALITISLALSAIAWNSGFGWMRDLLRDPGNRRVLRILIPAALILPVLPAVLELVLARQLLLSAVPVQLLSMLGNVLVVGTIAYWAVTRVAREQSVKIELSEAIDVTTMALTDADGNIVHWSAGAASLFGWSAAEAQGQNKYALLRSRCESAETSLPRRPEGQTQELVETARDGREIAIIERTHRVEIAGRAPVIVHKMTDVSDRSRAVSELRESEERLAIATATHEVGVFEWDVASGRIEWAPGAEELLGLNPGTITDFDSWRAQIQPEDVDSVIETIEQAVADRAPRFSFRYHFLEPNGMVRAVEGSSRAIYDSEGNLIRTVGAMLDITDREEREAALRRREAQLRSIIETVPEAMLAVDEEGTIRVFSAAAEALWDHRAHEVLGHHISMLTPYPEGDEAETRLSAFLKAGKPLDRGETIAATGMTRTGARFPMEVRASVAQVDGHLLFTLFARDLTEQFEAEERLSELNAEIAHVGRQSAMSELAADMAHELNQPLAATSNFLAAARMLMEKGEDSERITEMLRMANEQTLRAGEIIRRLRSFTMRGDVDMRVTPLGPTIRDAADLVLIGTSQFNIRLTYDLDPEIPCVFADRVQVQQVVVNLLRNSIDVLRQQGGNDRRITVSSRKSSDELVAIEIADSGPGIPEPMLEQLFSRFTTTKSKGGGMGIGLSISKRIIEAHGGILSAENRPEGGAVFRFTLPISEQGGE